MKSKTLFILSWIIIILSNSCKKNQTSEQCLAAEQERKERFLSIANDNILANEMIQIMMNNDNCKKLISENIIQDTMMINRLFVSITKDTNLSNLMITKSIGICDGNQLNCNLLKGTLKMYPSTLLYINKECCEDTKSENKVRNN